MLDNWQRIEKIIRWSGVASVSAFAREIGLNRGENLYQIKRGNNGISRELAETISTKYQALSKAWILTGEGEMIPSKASKIKYEIPFYKSDAAEFITGKEESVEQLLSSLPEPEYFVSFPMMQGCHFAAFTFSDAMAPEIPSGAVLFFRHTTKSEITPGSTYLVTSKKFSGIRKLRREPSSKNVGLVPKNIDNFDEITLPIGEIDELFVAKGVLINK